MKMKLVIDDGLIQEAMKLSGHQTKEAVVTEALQEYIQRRNQARIIKLFEKAISMRDTITRELASDRESKYCYWLSRFKMS